GLFEGFDRLEIDGGPITFIGGRIHVGFFGDFCDSDNLLIVTAVVIENDVSFFHGTEVVAGLKIADAGPFGAAVLAESLPRVGFGFLLYEPELLRHLSSVVKWRGKSIRIVLRTTRRQSH